MVGRDSEMWSRFQRWPWLNSVYSFAAGLCGFVVLLGSQPGSPIDRGAVDGEFAKWCVPVSMIFVCLVVPTCGVLIVGGFSKERESFIRLDLKHFPRGRHSLDTTFPRILSAVSTVILGFGWYYAQTNFFTSSPKGEVFPEHVIQFIGGLVLIFAPPSMDLCLFSKKGCAKSGRLDGARDWHNQGQ